MTTKSRTYWQEGGGDGDRFYCNICFKYGVILNGPGSAGKLIENLKRRMLFEGIHQKRYQIYKYFASK